MEYIEVSEAEMRFELDALYKETWGYTPETTIELNLQPRTQKLTLRIVNQQTKKYLSVGYKGFYYHWYDQMLINASNTRTILETLFHDLNQDEKISYLILKLPKKTMWCFHK